MVSFGRVPRGSGILDAFHEPTSFTLPPFHYHCRSPERGFQRAYQLLVVSAKDLQLCRAVLPAGEGHPFHTHPELEEIIYVLEGQVEQWVETEKRMLQPGEVAHIPAGVVHATFNPTGADAVILAILSPSKSQGPFMVDVSGEEPWKSLRTKA